ncbi:hypothetical protein IDJ75_18685 [Mucilaginibacter rigui]|uniref:PH domain-containing protein n=1 Tax=Mucilaginibacter rigui TaxID=534635 RepID=A0ABR7X9S3_9SPHI|nr:hypothetical protein [Mucilaginibacter rigui]MBD1387323.1 hypothetical protein [Mucilaginibacter rigui]
MFETVTVKQAIQHGRKMVLLPMLIIFGGILGGSIYLAFVQHIFFALPIGIWVGIIAAFVYRSIMITKWRLWAFENVRKVHELKTEASKALLLPVKDNFFEKTEIRTAAEKAKWLTLQQRFDKPDPLFFEEDPEVPAETIVRYSVMKKILWSLVFSVSFFAGLGLLYLGKETSNYVFGGVMTMFGGVFMCVCFKDALNRTPQIILNSEGMATVKTPFYPWRSISDEKVIVRGSGKGQTTYLTYTCPTGYTELVLDDFTVSPRQLGHLIQVYRGRSNS